MSPERALQSSDAPIEEPARDTHAADRIFQVGDVLPRSMGVAAMCKAFAINGRPMDRSTFHRHERAGKFERFELRPQIGRKAWSGTLVARYLDCEAGASRFVTAGRKVG